MKIILTNPEAPLRSAQRLVKQQRNLVLARTDLIEPATAMVGRWLAEHPACRQRAGHPDRTWCEAARRAHEAGESCATFRRRRAVTAEAQDWLKRVVQLARYAGEFRGASAHADPTVRAEAVKLLRGLRARRSTWEQVRDGSRRVRALVRARGCDRVASTAVRPPLTLAVEGSLGWREIVTKRELGALGRTHGYCTREPKYGLMLKSGLVRFFVLEDEGNKGLLALLSVRTKSRRVDDAHAPGNAPIPFAYRGAVIALLDHLGIDPGDQSDLLLLGLTGMLPAPDLEKPHLVVGDLSVWMGYGGGNLDEEEDEEISTLQPSFMLRTGDDFASLRPLGSGPSGASYAFDASPGSDFDSADLLGRLLTTLSEEAGAKILSA